MSRKLANSENRTRKALNKLGHQRELSRQNEIRLRGETIAMQAQLFRANQNEAALTAARESLRQQNAMLNEEIEAHENDAVFLQSKCFVFCSLKFPLNFT